ncbi:MAG: hypothetical protein FWH21_07240 [Kiritimatiellaeota bacterium]|nr:hypothetical protein [Kiritimatiellota bacterium]
MNRIAACVVVCYVLLLALLTLPVLGVCFWGDFTSLANGLKLGKEIVCNGLYCAFIGTLALCHVALLCLPVRIAREKPIAKRHIWIPAAATGLLTSCLALGVVVASIEAFRLNTPRLFLNSPFPLISVCGLIWGVWAIVFYLYTRRRDAQSVVRLHGQWLFRSSLLALLVAVPMHIVVRSRDYCCAGYSTFAAIAFGIPIMLISLGPGVFFLYASRRKQLKPKRNEERGGHDPTMDN